MLREIASSPITFFLLVLGIGYLLLRVTSKVGPSVTVKATHFPSVTPFGVPVSTLIVWGIAWAFIIGTLIYAAVTGQLSGGG